MSDLLRALYQTFHSSNESMIRLGDRLSPATESETDITSFMYRSMISGLARNSFGSSYSFSKYIWIEIKSTYLNVCCRTSRSQAPNVGINRFELPQAASVKLGSTHFMTFAASVAARPYSLAVFPPLC